MGFPFKTKTFDIDGKKVRCIYDHVEITKTDDPKFPYVRTYFYRIPRTKEFITIEMATNREL